MSQDQNSIYIFFRCISHGHITRLRQEIMHLNPLSGLYNETFSLKKEREILISTLPKDYMYQNIMLGLLSYLSR